MIKRRIGLWATGWALCCAVALARAQDAERVIKLGLTGRDAEKNNAEFRRYSRMMPVYREAGIEASRVELSGFERRDVAEERLLEELRGFHVVHLAPHHEGVTRITDAHRQRAARVGAVLAKYVGEGGGLFVQPVAVRYPGDQDEEYWNLVFEALGMEILHEGAFDKSRVFRAKTLHETTFWHTANIAPHPVTEGVRRLYLPLHAFGPFPGLVAMRYTDDWTVVARGEAEAQSYRSGLPGAPNDINIDLPGTYAAEPPVAAARVLGRGRIFCYPISPLYTGLNHRNPLWPDVVESRGDVDGGRPSDSMRLQMNAYRWLAEPALQNEQLGGYEPEPHRPVRFPPSVEWDRFRFGEPDGGVEGFAYADGQRPGFTAAATGIRGIAGVRTALTDGEGSVADFVRAAREAGLSVIVFNEPLELLTPETLEQLKHECAAESVEGEFYACPGVEFTDGIGNRWAFWGEKVKFPVPSFESGGRSYVQWDGQRVRHYGQYVMDCGYCASALLDYRQLRDNGAHPENLWWFWHYLPWVYDGEERVAENVDEWLFGLRDLRWSAIQSYTRIRSPGEVAAAAGRCFTGFRDLPSAVQALNTRCSPYFRARDAGQQVSQGPVIALWQAVNPQMEQHWNFTRGAQRVRLKFVVRSDAGIREVKVHDADRGVFRRFTGGGERELAREFEAVHDRQRYLTLEVVDVEGRRAFSWYLLIFCYKEDLARCGDNLNILGPTTLIWHPDRSQMFPLAKQFRNGIEFALQGWDTGSPALGVEVPTIQAWEMIHFADTGWYPHRYTLDLMLGKIMDVALSSHNVQMASMEMTRLVETHDSERPSPALATVTRDVEDAEYFHRTHTIVSPRDRADHYVIWNHRRRREGLQDYRGAFMWHEGEIRFKRDAVLDGALPVPLAWVRVPVDLRSNRGNLLIVADRDRGVCVRGVVDEEQPLHLQGRLRPGGYAAWMSSTVGYYGLFAPAGEDLRYQAVLPGFAGLKVGLGERGREVSAGEVWQYRFAVGTFADPAVGNERLEHSARVLNMGGGTDGYSVDLEVGTLVDAVFFFTVEATDHEALFRLGPQDVLIELPIRVNGLVDNGCAAVYSERRGWFRYVPVVEGTAWFQEDIGKANRMWAGNVFVCDRPEVRMTLVVDGQAEGRPPRLEVHNPTREAVRAEVRSPAHTPVFGGVSAAVGIPAGASVWLRFEDGGLAPEDG